MQVEFQILCQEGSFLKGKRAKSWPLGKILKVSGQIQGKAVRLLEQRVWEQ